jgi:hypothetical protein
MAHSAIRKACFAVENPPRFPTSRRIGRYHEQMAFLEYTPRQTLYQYCSPESFLGIVQSKALWYSDLGAGNDPREIALGYKHFIEALDAVKQEAKEPARSFFAYLREKMSAYHERTRAFSSCFSLAVDVLPMWGAYGNN